jgi:hypothetical protein
MEENKMYLDLEILADRWEEEQAVLASLAKEV